MVTAVDISPELLAVAADISAHIRPPIEFQIADVEQSRSTMAFLTVSFRPSASCSPSIREPPPTSWGVYAAREIA